MVMEIPSAQCVGREFVRQYYTLLHEAPKFLHRFYSHNSCFVHGGVEKPGEEQPPVQGQTEIHKKIISLNFRDCHAKIRQVDSQATVGNGVVVQVTGELSNSGQPMRRFMQTFVLAPQSPKKYYVHNDIFRYQDEVFHDSDNDTETLEETLDSDPEHVPAVSDQEPEQDNTITSQTYTYEGTPTDPQMPLTNGNALIAETNTGSPDGVVIHEEDRREPAEKQAPVVTKFEPVAEPKEPLVEPRDLEEAVYDEPQPQEQKNFSWAQRASMNTNSSAPPPAKQQQQQTQQHAPAAHRQAAPAATKPAEQKSAASSTDAAATGVKPAREPREQRPPRRSEQGRERDSSRSGAGEPDDFRRSSRFPDTHQLFVGNLPHNVSDKELREQFEEYGKVMEVRINRKTGRPDVPNFGFVVFESPESVGKVLNSKPISTHDGHRLNVEEKKQRSEQSARPGSGMRSGPRGGGAGPSRGGMGPPRGGRGGGGMGGGRSDMRGGGGGGGSNSDRGGPSSERGGPSSERGGRGGYGGPPPPRR